MRVNWGFQRDTGTVHLQKKGFGSLRAQERGLGMEQMNQHLDHKLLVSRTVGKQFLLFKNVASCYSRLSKLTKWGSYEIDQIVIIPRDAYFLSELQIPFAILSGYSEGGFHSHMASTLLVLKKCACLVFFSASMHIISPDSQYNLKYNHLQL
jgi:hypothetical protein